MDERCSLGLMEIVSSWVGGGHSNLVSLVKDGPCVLRDWCGYKYGMVGVSDSLVALVLWVCGGLFAIALHVAN